MENSHFDTIVEKIVERDSRYCKEAYAFVEKSVTYTVKKCNKVNRFFAIFRVF